MPINMEKKIVEMPLDKIKPYHQNIKQHPQDQIEKIAESIKRFGFNVPLVVDTECVIVAGHGRYEAAKILGIKSVPVIVKSDLSAAEIRAYRIADNKLNESLWDKANLAIEVKAIGMELMSLAGFNSIELGNFGLTLDSKTDEDDVPAAPKKPKTKKGDLYIMGDHRLLCGDSTSKDDVARLMNGHKAVLMNTDPPYGVDYGDIANSRDRAENKRQGGTGKVPRDESKSILNDDLDGIKLQKFLEASIKSALPHLIKNPAFYLWHPMLTQGVFFAAAAAAAADILIHRQIIWIKPSLILGRGDYHWKHELCFYGWIKGKKCNWYAGRDQHTTWEIGRENDHIHPTQKPVELFLRPIHNHTKMRDVVYEPFSGSGSQFIAAEKTGRRCYGMEISPVFCDVIISRWENYTGKKACIEKK